MHEETMSTLNVHVHIQYPGNQMLICKPVSMSTIVHVHVHSPYTPSETEFNCADTPA